jgi:hypothetical protein
MIGSTALNTAAYAATGDFAPASGIALSALANQAAYTILANGTAGAAAPTEIAPVANGIWACTVSSVCGYQTNISLDDSAAQFYSATASKGTRKLVQSSISDTMLLTDTPIITGNVTWTNVSQGAGTYTRVFEEAANVFTVKQEFDATTGLQVGSTGVLITSDNDGALTFLGASGGYDESLVINLDDYENSIDVTSGSDATEVNFNTLDFVTSGTIRGGIKQILMGTGATYTFSAVDAYGSMIIQNDSDSATTVNLPDYDPNATARSTTKVKLGASFCVLTLSAYATIINPADDDKIRTTNGTLNGVGVTITGPATVGAYSCYVLTDAQSTKGTAADATTDATGYATTTTTVALASAGTGTILFGDIITFDGDATKYTVTAGDADVSDGGNITFTPGLVVAIETSAHAITVVETATGHWTQMGLNGAWPVTP